MKSKDKFPKPQYDLDELELPPPSAYALQHPHSPEDVSVSALSKIRNGKGRGRLTTEEVLQAARELLEEDAQKRVDNALRTFDNTKLKRKAK